MKSLDYATQVPEYEGLKAELEEAVANGNGTTVPVFAALLSIMRHFEEEIEKLKRNNLYLVSGE